MGRVAYVEGGNYVKFYALESAFGKPKWEPGEGQAAHFARGLTFY